VLAPRALSHTLSLCCSIAYGAVSFSQRHALLNGQPLRLSRRARRLCIPAKSTAHGLTPSRGPRRRREAVQSVACVEATKPIAKAVALCAILQHNAPKQDSRGPIRNSRSPGGRVAPAQGRTQGRPKNCLQMALEAPEHHRTRSPLALRSAPGGGLLTYRGSAPTTARSATRRIPNWAPAPLLPPQPKPSSRHHHSFSSSSRACSGFRSAVRVMPPGCGFGFSRFATFRACNCPRVFSVLGIVDSFFGFGFLFFVHFCLSVAPSRLIGRSDSFTAKESTRRSTANT